MNEKIIFIILLLFTVLSGASQENVKYRMASWNIQNNGAHKLDIWKSEISDILARNEIDIVFIQEYQRDVKEVNIPGYVAHFVSDPNYTDVKTYYSTHLTDEEIEDPHKASLAGYDFTKRKGGNFETYLVLIKDELKDEITISPMGIKPYVEYAESRNCPLNVSFPRTDIPLNTLFRGSCHIASNYFSRPPGLFKITFNASNAEAIFLNYHASAQQKLIESEITEVNKFAEYLILKHKSPVMIFGDLNFDQVSLKNKVPFYSHLKSFVNLNEQLPGEMKCTSIKSNYDGIYIHNDALASFYGFETVFSIKRRFDKDQIFVTYPTITHEWLNTYKKYIYDKTHFAEKDYREKITEQRRQITIASNKLKKSARKTKVCKKINERKKSKETEEKYEAALKEEKKDSVEVNKLNEQLNDFIVSKDKGIPAAKEAHRNDAEREADNAAAKLLIQKIKSKTTHCSAQELKSLVESNNIGLLTKQYKEGEVCISSSQEYCYTDEHQTISLSDHALVYTNVYFPKLEFINPKNTQNGVAIYERSKSGSKNCHSKIHLYAKGFAPKKKGNVTYYISADTEPNPDAYLEEVSILSRNDIVITPQGVIYYEEILDANRMANADKYYLIIDLNDNKFYDRGWDPIIPFRIEDCVEEEPKPQELDLKIKAKSNFKRSDNNSYMFSDDPSKTQVSADEVTVDETRKQLKTDNLRVYRPDNNKCYELNFNNGTSDSKLSIGQVIKSCGEGIELRFERNIDYLDDTRELFKDFKIRLYEKKQSKIDFSIKGQPITSRKIFFDETKKLLELKAEWYNYSQFWYEQGIRVELSLNDKHIKEIPIASMSATPEYQFDLGKLDEFHSSKNKVNDLLVSIRTEDNKVIKEEKLKILDDPSKHFNKNPHVHHKTSSFWKYALEAAGAVAVVAVAVVAAPELVILGTAIEAVEGVEAATAAVESATELVEAAKTAKDVQSAEAALEAASSVRNTALSNASTAAENSLASVHSIAGSESSQLSTAFCHGAAPASAPPLLGAETSDNSKDYQGTHIEFSIFEKHCGGFKVDPEVFKKANNYSFSYEKFNPKEGADDFWYFKVPIHEYHHVVDGIFGHKNFLLVDIHTDGYKLYSTNQKLVDAVVTENAKATPISKWDISLKQLYTLDKESEKEHLGFGRVKKYKDTEEYHYYKTKSADNKEVISFEHYDSHYDGTISDPVERHNFTFPVSAGYHPVPGIYNCDGPYRHDDYFLLFNPLPNRNLYVKNFGSDYSYAQDCYENMEREISLNYMNDDPQENQILPLTREYKIDGYPRPGLDLFIKDKKSDIVKAVPNNYWPATICESGSIEDALTFKLQDSKGATMLIPQYYLQLFYFFYINEKGSLSMSVRDTSFTEKTYQIFEEIKPRTAKDIIVSFGTILNNDEIRIFWVKEPSKDSDNTELMLSLYSWRDKILRTTTLMKEFSRDMRISPYINENHWDGNLISISNSDSVNVYKLLAFKNN